MNTRFSNAPDEHSDSESINNALSPIDGYFNERHSQPQDVMVPDPSQEQQSQRDTTRAEKDREAQAEAAANRSYQQSSVAAATDNAPGPSESTSRYSSRFPVQTAPRRSSRNTRTYNLDFEEQPGSSPQVLTAPPPYSPSDENSYQHSRQNSWSSVRDYNTMNSPIFPNSGERNPQDMGGQPLLGGAHRREDPRDRMRGWARSKGPLTAKTLFLLLVVLAGIGFMACVVKGFVEAQDHDTQSPMKDVPDEIDPPESCPYATQGGNAKVIFGAPGNLGSPKNLGVMQRTKLAGHHGPEFVPVDVSGVLHVWPSDESTYPSVHAKIQFKWSDHVLVEETDIGSGIDYLALYTPDFVLRSKVDTNRPCLYVEINVWLGKDTNFETIGLSAMHLSVVVHDGVSVKANSLSIATTAGSVSFPDRSMDAVRVNVREIEVKCIAGSINGVYPLFDLLKLETVAGSVNVNLDLKEEDEDEPRPAKLEISTQSGSITVGTPAIGAATKKEKSLIPKREYRSTFKATAGGIKANVVHGTISKFSTQMGSIVAELSPYGPPHRKSNIDVDSTSGSIRVNVLDSISNPDKPLRNLNGNYQFASGSLTLHYPLSWEGKVQGSTLSGSITTHWPGLQITKSKGTWVGNEIKGFKGKGDALLSFNGMSGSVSLYGDGTYAPLSAHDGDYPNDCIQNGILIPGCIPLGGDMGSNFPWQDNHAEKDLQPVADILEGVE